MKDRIKAICKDIEAKENIKILFAIENGSRAWRMDSKNSDYDVRFVFVRPLDEYIQIDKPVDVISVTLNKEGKPCPPKGAFIDISGFDLFKYVKMLSVSNPTTIEWLMSDIVYYGKQNEIFKNFAVKHFNPKSLYLHYKSLCRNNYQKYLKTGNQVTYKKYLYAYRGVVNAKWVAHKKTVPPIIFSETVKKMNGLIPDSVIKKILEIITLKSQGKEGDIISNIAKLDSHIEGFLEDDSETPAERLPTVLGDLNKELRKIVLNNKEVNIGLSQEEAIVLFEFLEGLNTKDLIKRKSDKKIVWDVISMIEKQSNFLINNPKYQEKLEKARKRLTNTFSD